MIHVILLLLFWPPQQTPSSDVQQYIQAAVQAEKAGHFDVAIAEFKKAADLDPNQPQAFVGLGQAYMENRDYGAAIAPLKHALELNPDIPIAHQFLGYALLAQGYPAEAIPHLERVGAQDALAIAELEAGQLPEAVNNLQQALAKRPNDQDLLYYLGRASGLLSKQSIDALLNAYPDSARAHQALAENYFVLRQMPQAEKEFKEALRQRPDIPGIHLELGLVYAGASQWPKAEEQFRAEAKLQPGNAEAAYRVGSALLQQGKPHDARAELERSDRLKPEMPETLYSLGKAASLDGDPAAAEKAWTKVIDLEKETSLAAQSHFGLAALYRKQGKTAQAQHELQEFQKLQGAIGSPRSE